MRSYGISRDLAAALARRLPHVTLGGKGRGIQVVVERTAFERLINKAVEERADLWTLANMPEEKLTAWLGQDIRKAN